MSKNLQVIVTIPVTNDEFALLVNPISDLTIETLLAYKTANQLDTLSIDLPAVLLD